MIALKDYKILKTINEINEKERKDPNHCSDYILKGKILASLKLKEYELDEAMYRLDKMGYIADIFSADKNEIYASRLTDSGKCLIADFKKIYAKHIFDKYIWQILIVILTVVLTKMFD